jgi:hypothetical protein
MDKAEFENMPLDELESFIASGGEVAKEAEVVEDVQEEKVTESDQVVEESAVEAQEEEIAVEEQSKSTEEEQAVQEEEVDPLLKKTPEELARIIKDQQYYEARRGEELGKIRSELAELKKQKLEESVSELDEVSRDNIEVVEEALKHIRAKEALEQERVTEAQTAFNFEQNRSAWEKLRQNKELSEAVSSELDERFESLGATQEDRVRVMSQNPDWVSTTMLEILGQKVASKERAEADAAEAKSSVAKRKAKASTNVGTTAKSKMTKSVEEMSFDEYEEYFKENFRKS